MIKLTIGDNLSRKSINVMPNQTPKEILAQEGRELGLGIVMLDGGALSTKEINTPIGDLLNGATSATLLQIVKANNA